MVMQPSMHAVQPSKHAVQGLGEGLVDILADVGGPSDAPFPVGGLADAPAPSPGFYDEFDIFLSSSYYGSPANAPGELPAYIAYGCLVSHVVRT